MKRLLSALALVACFASSASASSITANFSTTFSNTTVPGGSAPYLVGVFDDTLAGLGYDVRLTLTTPGLTADEFISEIYFNLDPALLPQDLSFNVIQNPGPTLASISRSPNTYQADGDGIYDIRFNFNTNDGQRFEAGDTVIIDIKLNVADGGPLALEDFAWLAEPGGGSGPFFGAAHLQGIVPNNGADSTWLGVTVKPTLFNELPPTTTTPEPASLVLLGTGLLGLAWKARRRR